MTRSRRGRAAAVQPDKASPRAPGGWRRWLWQDGTLFLAALLVRLVLWALWLQAQGSRGGLELGTLADSIVAGDGFRWNFYGTEQPPGDPVPRLSFFPPFYPGLLALAKLTVGEGWGTAVQLVQIVCGSALPLVVRRLATRLLRDELAWVTAWLAVVWPPFVFYTSELFPVTFHTLGVPAALLLLISQRHAPRLWPAALKIGALYGLLAYSLPSFLGSLVLMPLGLRGAGTSWRRAVALPLASLGVALVLLAPWTVRNAVVQGRFVPVATNLGFNFAGANNPYSRPDTNVLCAKDNIRWQVVDRRALETMNEADFDRMLLRQGLSYMAAHPGRTLKRIGTRILYYWWTIPDMLRYNHLQGLGGVVLMSVLTPLALTGAIVAWRRRRRAPYAVLLAACGWMTLFYMNFAVRGRYSLAIHPVMLILAVLAVAWLAARRQPGDGIERPGGSSPVT
ncbi:MAG: hypothetical protein PVF43_05580 [Candidatus Eiseniibacteriota bacterium]